MGYMGYDVRSQGAGAEPGEDGGLELHGAQNLGSALSTIVIADGPGVIPARKIARPTGGALNDHPDLIIIDEPVTEFIELLREKPKNKLPKLFLISRDRYSEHEKEILADKLNTVEILRLPFDIDEFEEKISDYL